jgi:hypothetical protein
MLLNLLDGPTKGDFGRKEISKESLTDGLVGPTSMLLTFFSPFFFFFKFTISTICSFTPDLESVDLLN